MSITGVGLCIRVAFVWFGARSDGPVGDQLFYSAQAIANAGGRWFEQPFAAGHPAADHPPLTSLVITPITWIAESTGSIVTAQRLFMVFLGCAGIVLVALLGRTVAGPGVGIVAAAITAVYVNIWINDGLIMAETPTFLLVTVLTTVCLRVCDRPTRRHFAAAGALSGLAALTRPELIALVPLLALLFIGYLRRQLPWRDLGAGVVLLVCAAGTVLAPWVIWNHVRFDAPVFLSTNDGMTLAGANCDSTYYVDVGGWDIRCAYETSVPEGADASQASASMRRDGLAYWRAHLERYPVVAVARLARVFSVGYVGSTAEAGTAEGRPTWLSFLGMVQYWALIPAAVLGFRRCPTGPRRAVLVVCLPIVVAVAAVANAYVRFRIPSEVGLVVLASIGAESLWIRARSRLDVSSRAAR